MSPVERMQALEKMPHEPWSLERLTLSTHDALSRWRVAQERLGIAFGFPPQGIVSTVAPDFILSPNLAALVPSDNSTRSFITLGFLTWATCPATHGIPNPFEPMLDFIHHGGTFSIEHGFIDIYAPSGEKAGIYMLQHGTQHI